MQLVTFDAHPDDGPQTPGRSARRTFSDGTLGLEALESVWPGRNRLGARIPSGPRAGDVVDLNRALAVMLAYEDVGAPEVEADSLLPANLLGFLQHGSPAHALAEQALSFCLGALAREDAPDLVRAGVVVPRGAVALRAPLPRPGKLIGVACNYAAPAAQIGQRELPKEPILFIKPATAVVGPNDAIVIPRASCEVDSGGELAVVIGRRARNVEQARALEYVGGYLPANDLTARNFEDVRGQHFLGKSCDTFAPMGPALLTADEIPEPQNLAIQTTISEIPLQSTHTSQMLFSVEELIAFASRLMTLEPGDVILTGTPPGPAATAGATTKEATAQAPRWLRAGDVVEVEIEGVGRLRNPVRDEA